ncbi:class 3 adenylate cyclase [Stackebrandtia albiflava]|uniref:Class 3 adenylate cyclase n=1 Tax=Stackebrandtia albiflava TaxID=406432 RepID=A0A562V247_9ACTN|nr:adenylate/guanylate cyclase domain-containing protein [Stackebrandtia albiflava]TWJ11915.1 class 3 adenylate cyclase [Stackebrandtia albiflava]
MGGLTSPGSGLPSGLVTFLFTDIEGSTRLACELGDGYRRVLHDHRRLLRRVFSRRVGTELLTEGDSFFVAFADAAAAVAAAVTAQRMLARHEWPTAPHWSAPARPRVRMGLHTGHAVPDAQGYATSIVHRAARVCAAAHGDQILCSQSTLEACTELPADVTAVDLGLHRLRGFDDSLRLHQLTAVDLPSRFPPPATESRHHNLPADSDRFIGRRDEQCQLIRLLDGHRLVSVTALPQTGKSRLVCHLGRELASTYRDGVWYADLSRHVDLGEALSAALGLRGDPFRSLLDAVIEVLRHRHCLLVLDDTRTQDAAQVTRLLAECQKVSVLSASRHPLGLAGEVKWALPTMSVPDAAELLRSRARAASGGVDPGDCTALARYVDGFPPAVNVLAAAVPVLGTDGLLRRLREDPLNVLDACGELSTVLDKVCEELTPRAAHLLRALSTWPTPAGVDEVERLCGGSAAALDALINLVDASLVDVHHTETGAAYRLPAPVRWYADDRRRRAGESNPRLTPMSAGRMPLPRLSWAQALPSR